MTHPIPKQALDDRLAFIGTSGSGKTHSAGTCVERPLLDKARAIVVDPLGVWWGLRIKADGADGFSIPIFGGAHGDLALTEHAGALIGETVADMAESCIIDLSQINTKAGERRFMLAFLTAIYRGVNGSPVHVVFDEADMWAPQRLLDKDGEAAKLLGMIEPIVRSGRVKLRAQAHHPEATGNLEEPVEHGRRHHLVQADVLAGPRCDRRLDRGPGRQARGEAILAPLPSLERGRGVVWMPARGILERASVPQKVTFDSSRIPKRGESVPTASLKPLDLSALKARLSVVDGRLKPAHNPCLAASGRAKTRRACPRAAPRAEP